MQSGIFYTAADILSYTAVNAAEAIDILFVVSLENKIKKIQESHTVWINITFLENTWLCLMFSAQLSLYGNPLQHTQNRN